MFVHNIAIKFFVKYACHIIEIQINNKSGYYIHRERGCNWFLKIYFYQPIIIKPSILTNV